MESSCLSGWKSILINKERTEIVFFITAPIKVIPDASHARANKHHPEA